MSDSRLIGTVMRRREDPRLITGSASYVDDIRLPHMAYMAVLRSPHAHARIRSIDTHLARSHPAALAVVTAADIGPPVAHSPDQPDQRSPEEPVGEQGAGPRPPLAVDTVRYVGEGVAAIVARDRYTLEDILELVEVDYEPLPAYLDLAHRAESWDFPDANLDDHGRPVGTERAFEAGDVEGAFREASIVMSRRMVNQRLAPIPMETRGVVADYRHGAQELLVYDSTQCAQFVRDALSDTIGLPHSRVRVIAPDVGGAFGCKIGDYPEDLLAAHLSMRLGRPVKWIETRSENLQATVHGRSVIAHLELAADRSGRLLGLKLDLDVDTGASDASWLASTVSAMITGCYEIKNVRTSARTVFTNKVPLGAYRGAGRPEAAYFIERGMDLLANELSIEPEEVRRLNFIPPDSFPYKTPDWPLFDSGRYEATMQTALERAEYRNLLSLRERAREEGKLMGVGFASYVEVTGFGWETATVTVDSDATAVVYTGISPHGQGQETTFAQIVAHVCGLDPADVKVVYGDTSLGYGQGTMGSRGTSVGGTAVHQAALTIRDKMIEIAAGRLEVSPYDLDLVDGAWRVKGVPDRLETVKDVAAAACSGSELPAGLEPGLRATSSFKPENVTAPFGTHVAAVEIDGETGSVSILKYLTVDDCGTIISPQLVEGQVQGGVMQGVAQGLHEEVRYDQEGQLLTGSLVSYAIPTIGEMLPIEVTHTTTPSLRNELGVKGIGEAGSIGSTPAIVNAVMDALSPLGIRHLDMPLTPERVWAAIRGAGVESGVATATA